MPDTPTARLGLYKSASDGSEDVDYTQDLGNNWDRLDLATGYLACTSTTRPSTPYNGQGIRETDTGRLWVSNGSAPASGSWKEVCTPGTVQTFTGGMANVGALSTTTVNAAYVTADTSNRWAINAAGKQSWGPGNAATDTTLARTAAGELTVGGNLVVTGIGQVMFARKTADTGRTSTTVSSDPHLTFSVTSGCVYELSGTIFLSTTDTTNADLLASFTAPASTAGYWNGVGQDPTSTSDHGAARTIATTFGGGTRQFGGLSTDTLSVVFTGLVAPTASGTFAFQWARQGSSGTMTVVSGSYMKLERVA